MVEPEKPFACVMPDCGMTFTNEDHLHVHTKKHDMVLQLGNEQKAAFVVADQTPTPTRFIRNCEEVGLFQDLQNVNPFDEGFKRAMETKAGILSLEASSDDVGTLHTPQMVFPQVDGDAALYTSNNQRNITISRSSSDESGAVKEYETTTISKQTNEVTTISRIVGKPDILDKVTTTDDVSIIRHEDINKEINETVSYTNNVIKIQSNVEIRKDGIIETTKNAPRTLISYDSVIKDAHVTKDVLLTDKPEKVPPIMSQKSLDYVVDSLEEHNDANKDKERQIVKMLKRNYEKAISKSENKLDLDDFEIIIKKPDGRQVRMKPVEDDKSKIQDQTKERLKKVLTDKAEKKTNETKIDTLSNLLPITSIPTLPGGTLVPVTIVNPNTILITNTLQKIPIVPFNVNKVSGNFKKTVKRKDCGTEKDSNGVIVAADVDKEAEKKKMLEPRTAASRRYREKQKVLMNWQAEENRLLKDTNHKLVAENAALKLLITEHLKKCSNPGDLKLPQDDHHTIR